MDLPKFLMMLEQNGLYFSTLAELAALEDKWEAVIGRQMAASIASHFNTVSGNVIDLFQQYLKNTFVNCWYHGTTESVAMWKLYTHSDFGVAISSTIGDLKKSLEVYDQPVFIGTVEYRDHTEQPMDILAFDAILPYRIALQKRVCYRHEQELRLLTDFRPDFPQNPEPGMIFRAPFPKHGKVVSAELSLMISSITTGPNFPAWTWQLLKSALVRADLNCPVVESDAFKPPDVRVLDP
ncbi:MAG TPA: hypothetical protein VGR47_03930 [Terracidiphilus sp.]|nr:hypothetical protein [Terracidiphilus sp.]